MSKIYKEIVTNNSKNFLYKNFSAKRKKTLDLIYRRYFMSRSEFRWNKKRKHYAYLHKDLGDFRKNILLTSKPKVFKKKNGKIKVIFNNVKLYAHPNPNKKINLKGLPTAYYVIPKNYVDNISSFDEHVFEDWSFDINDKRKIKRLKKERK